MDTPTLCWRPKVFHTSAQQRQTPIWPHAKYFLGGQDIIRSLTEGFLDKSDWRMLSRESMIVTEVRVTDQLKKIALRNRYNQNIYPLVAVIIFMKRELKPSLRVS